MYTGCCLNYLNVIISVVIPQVKSRAFRAALQLNAILILEDLLCE